jgi:hypothetical protein
MLSSYEEAKLIFESLVTRSHRPGIRCDKSRRDPALLTEYGRAEKQQLEIPKTAPLL